MPALRRLAAAFESMEGAALLTDSQGIVSRLHAEPSRRKMLAEHAVAEGLPLFEPPRGAGTGRPASTFTASTPADGPSLRIAADLSGAVAPIRSRSGVWGFVGAVVPAARGADRSSLFAAACLAAYAIEETHRAALEAEGAARERAHLHGVIEGAPDPIVLLDAAGRILEANPLAVRVLGVRLEAGSALEDVLLGSGVLDREGTAALRAIETGTVAAAEVRVGSGAGRKPFLVEASPIRRAGEISARVMRFRSQQDAARLAAGSHALADVERRTLALALDETRWNISETARRLGVTRPTVYSMIRRHRISPGSR